MALQSDVLTDKLCLGTVQFGMNYGIKNARRRQPTEAECHGVLNAARRAGISYLDTASVYGSAEDVLGAYGVADKGFCICSKLRPDETPRSAEEEKAFVVTEAKRSVERLGISHLYGYLLHRAADMHRPGVIEGLLAVREQGLAEHIGVSIYEPEDAMDVVHDSRLDIIQIPYNALDQRLDRAGFFAASKADGRGLEVFARSAFLQGLLLMDPKNLPANVQRAEPFLSRFQQISAAHGFKPIESAMLYSLVHPGIDHVVFGVDTEEQLAENLRVAARAEEFRPCYDALRGAFDDVPRDIVVPSLW